MNILVADDDRVSRRMLEAILIEWGYEVRAACNGEEAWQILQGKDPPRLAIIDWMMPGLDGLEVCRNVRALPDPPATHLILLTVRNTREDMLTGLRSGADDFIRKPFDLAELQARLQVGRRMVDLRLHLADRVRALEESLMRVKKLQGLLPICSYCKQIRDDQNYWHEVETYIRAHSDATFSHGICPGCWEKVVKPEFQRDAIRAPDAAAPG